MLPAGSVSAIGAISILVAIVIIIIKLVWLDASEYEPEPGREPAWAARVPLLPAAVGIMDVLFGYAGECMFSVLILDTSHSRYS